VSAAVVLAAAPEQADGIPAITFRGRELLDARSGAVLAHLGDDEVWRDRAGAIIDGLDLPAPLLAVRPSGPPRATPDPETNAAWMRGAIETVREIALTHRTLTADDVWAKLRFPPLDGRQLGPLMRACQRLGLVEPTEEHRPSSRPGVHRRPVRVWRSLICDGLALFDPDTPTEAPEARP
jgi:hypothetical protein